MNAILLLTTLNLALGGLVFVLGFLILRENPAHRVNRTVALMLFFGGLGSILAGLAFIAGRTHTSGAHAEMLGNVSYLWEFYFPTLFLFASVFPEERAYTRRFVLFPGRWWTPGFGALVYAPHTFHFAITLALLVWHPSTLNSTGSLRLLAPVLGLIGVFLHLFLLVHRALFSLVNLGFGVATMVLLISSWRRATLARLRQQLRVITFGLGLSLACYTVATLIPALLSLRLDEQVRAALIIAALTAGPGSIAYSIVRYRFLDARLLARRGILYALVSGALLGLYLLLVSRLGHAVTQATGLEPRVFEPVLLILSLALFQPAIARLEQALDRMLLKDPNDYRNVLRQLGRDLQTTIDLETLLTRTLRTLSAALLGRRTLIVVRAGDGWIARAGDGEPVPSEGQIARLGETLARVPATAASVRLDAGTEELMPADLAFLANDLEASLLVPLRWRGDWIGALLLGEKITSTPYTSEDVTLLTTLAEQVSVSLQIALLLRERVEVARFEEELNLARRIQRTSLLSVFPTLPNAEVHALSIPSKAVGGDFYDVVSDGDGAHLIAIADVSGKGVPAAMLSSMLQASLRTQAGSVRDLPEILRNINTLLFHSTEIHQFATFFLARVETSPPRLVFSNAGHNWPVVIRRQGGREFLERGGTLLGIMESVRFDEGEVSLAPGDRVVLYTDGISEAANAEGEQYGEERLVELLESLPAELCAREVAESILEALHAFLGPTEPQDDLTLLVLRLLEPTEARVVPGPVGEAVAAG